MRHKKILFREASGTQNIHAQLWLPDAEPRAVVQVVHGVNEYGVRYAAFAEYFTARGIAVAEHDLMGHGETAAETDTFGQFAPHNGWENSLADIRNFSALLRTRYPALPLVILGHSMGSFMVRCLISECRDDYDAVILSGTSHNLKTIYTIGALCCFLEQLRIGENGRSKLLRTLCFGRYTKKFAAEQHPAAWIVRDSELYKQYGKDPWCRFVPTVGMFREMFRGMRRMDWQGNYCRVRPDIPMLLIAGGADPVGNEGRGVRKVYRRFIKAGVRDVTIKLYPEARHELLSELNKEEVYEDILYWLSKRVRILRNK